ncbi:hypothetical protein L7F22_040670 [Adiantum nelumboides]|nr:hypothetical protein [Adiantum nelumboides]
MASTSQNPSGQGVHMNPNGVPTLQSLPYENLTPLEKPKPYKEDGRVVTIKTFSGFDDRKKALSFLEQFDKVFCSYSDVIGISWLLSRQNTLSFKCLTGNADGLGTIREQEMLSACSFLKVPRENVDILDDPALQDGQSVIWRPVLISQVIERTVTSHNIDMIITFDSYGVSGHPNHTAVYWGVCEFLLRSAKSYKQEDLCVEAWNLESVGILKKYSGPIYGLWSMWRYRTTYQSHQFFSRSPLYCFQAMQKHATQWLWYRRLFVVFSHYSYMNTLRRFTT